MTAEPPFFSAGFFTWLDVIYDKPASQLEQEIGYSPGSLANGWRLYTPRVPLNPANIDLQGNARFSAGVLPDGQLISDTLASRIDVGAARHKVAAYFSRGLDKQPVKVIPNSKPTSYPPAPKVGLPQFKLHTPVEWIFIVAVPRGALMTRTLASSARW